MFMFWSQTSKGFPSYWTLSCFMIGFVKSWVNLIILWRAFIRYFVAFATGFLTKLTNYFFKQQPMSCGSLFVFPLAFLIVIVPNISLCQRDIKQAPVLYKFYLFDFFFGKLARLQIYIYLYIIYDIESNRPRLKHKRKLDKKKEPSIFVS